MSLLEHQLRELARDGVRINIWPCDAGYQANVAERAGKGWTCVTRVDPIEALQEALRQRASGVTVREVYADGEPEQIDIEEAIAAADRYGGCVICEDGGCDVCRPVSTALDDLLG